MSDDELATLPSTTSIAQVAYAAAVFIQRVDDYRNYLAENGIILRLTDQHRLQVMETAADMIRATSERQAGAA